jgi:TolB-like protein
MKKSGHEYSHTGAYAGSQRNSQKLLLSAAIALILGGCSSGLPEDQRSGSVRRADNKFQPLVASPQRMSDEQFGDVNQQKNINHYVRGIMHQLVGNLQYVNNQTPIGVSSFVFLDSNLKQTSLLGYQVAESFVHEIHQVGIPVIDFKTMDFIRVTAQGDFIFSRDFLELQSAVPIQYILTGTLVKYRGGYLVNARIIGLGSKAVVSSAQGFIPNRIADALLEHDGLDGINLSQRQ